MREHPAAFEEGNDHVVQSSKARKGKHHKRDQSIGRDQNHNVENHPDRTAEHPGSTAAAPKRGFSFFNRKPKKGVEESEEVLAKGPIIEEIVRHRSERFSDERPMDRPSHARGQFEDWPESHPVQQAEMNHAEDWMSSGPSNDNAVPIGMGDAPRSIAHDGEDVMPLEEENAVAPTRTKTMHMDDSQGTFAIKSDNHHAQPEKEPTFAVEEHPAAHIPQEFSNGQLANDDITKNENVQSPSPVEVPDIEPQKKPNIRGRGAGRVGRGARNARGGRLPAPNAHTNPDERELPATSTMQSVTTDGTPANDQVAHPAELPTTSIARSKQTTKSRLAASREPEHRKTGAPQKLSRTPSRNGTPGRRSRLGSAQRRVIFKSTRVPVSKSRTLGKGDFLRTTDSLLSSLETLASKHTQLRAAITEVPGSSGHSQVAEAISSNPHMPPDEKISLLSRKLADTEAEANKLHEANVAMTREMTTLKKRVVREVERAKPLPKVTSTVPTSVEATLNLRYQFKKILDNEREKYHRLEEENRRLAMKVKELESKPNRREPTSATTSHRTNEILSLRKKLKEAELEKRRLEDMINSTQKQLERESKAKERIDRDRDAMRQQFTHLKAMSLGVLSEESVNNSQSPKDKPTLKGSARKISKLDRLVKGLRPTPLSRTRLKSTGGTDKSTGIVGPDHEPKSVVKNAEKTASRHTVKGPKDVRKNSGQSRKLRPDAAMQDTKTVIPPPELNQHQPEASRDRDVASIEAMSASNKEQADMVKGKLPDVFRKPRNDRQRSVLANLDRDLREAGDLIDSLDQSLLKKRQRMPTGGSSALGDGEADVGVRERWDDNPSHDKAEDGLPGNHDVTEERLRSAKIKLEYDIWVKRKKEESADRE